MVDLDETVSSRRKKAFISRCLDCSCHVAFHTDHSSSVIEFAVYIQPISTFKTDHGSVNDVHR